MSYLIQYEPKPEPSGFWYRWLENPRKTNEQKAETLRRIFKEKEGGRTQLHRQIANLKKKLWRAENPGWHKSKRWGIKDKKEIPDFAKPFVTELSQCRGDNEWRLVIILKPGVSPITFYRAARNSGSYMVERMKGGSCDDYSFTPFTAKAHKSRRQGKEVWIITWDIRRDC